MKLKEYLKLNKYKLEDVYNDVFVVSKIVKTKADNCNGRNFYNWKHLSFTYFDVIQFLPGDDYTIIISNYGGRHKKNTSFLFTSNNINNINKLKI